MDQQTSALLQSKIETNLFFDQLLMHLLIDLQMLQNKSFILHHDVHILL